MAKVGYFKDKFDPVKIQLEDIGGNKRTLTQQTMITPEVQNEIEKMIYDDNVKTTEKIISQLVIIFGEDFNFWKVFSMQTLADILIFFAETAKKK
jgi:hypothetical protein